MRKREESSFEIYEYDNALKEFSRPAIGWGRGKSAEEACQNFIEETGWSAENEDKLLWAKHPICR
tara:strand:- start:40 stop:234 length:195 start_codon:yes stop_codon:yes gene_type:complete